MDFWDDDDDLVVLLAAGFFDDDDDDDDYDDDNDDYDFGFQVKSLYTQKWRQPRQKCRKAQKPWLLVLWTGIIDLTIICAMMKPYL